MTDCPNCAYHRKRAQLWRDEAYKQAGHPLPEREREWVGLTDEDWAKVGDMPDTFDQGVAWAQARLKERNT